MTLVSGDKPAVTTAGKQQWLVPVVGIGFDRAKEDHMIAAVIAVDSAALEVCDTVQKKRCAAETRGPFDAGKLVLRGFRKLVRKPLLRCAQHVDRKMAGVLEHAQTG